MQLPGRSQPMKTTLILTLCALLLLNACQSGPMPNPAQAGQPQASAVPASQTPEGMVNSEIVTIPAGTFWLGCDPAYNSNLSCLKDELPSQSVQLPEFKIDKQEVTNAKYAECVQSGACTSPSSLASETHEKY